MSQRKLNRQEAKRDNSLSETLALLKRQTSEEQQQTKEAVPAKGEQDREVRGE